MVYMIAVAEVKFNHPAARASLNPANAQYSYLTMNTQIDIPLGSKPS